MTESNEGLIFRGEIPLVVNRLDKLPGEFELAKANRSNEVLLKTSLLVNENPDLDEHHELAPFLLKQDIKINLILDLLSELIRDKAGTPTAEHIQLSPEALVLETNQVVDGASAFAKLNLYLIAEVPKPLEFFATVIPSAEGCRFEFQQMDPCVKDQLEKILFRYHRRKIALQKAGRLEDTHLLD